MQRREQEDTQAFAQIYAKIEGTLSQGVRTIGLRRSRYVGETKTHSQHIATAATLNVVRSMAWFSCSDSVLSFCSPLRCGLRGFASSIF
ncbi:transposase [Ktedonospora formicarum]|uniref:transposase n=1 Tax=Ktedonospora formicarum TaxID=2778364 RepID=UPI003B75C08E